MTQVLSAPGSAVLEVKKSRFLAHAARLPDPDGAAALISQLSDPDARHNCWAWRFAQQYRFFDAGEPGGTAGKPILAAIDGAEIDQVLVVVTRHFGGIKLGTGGLVRAYGKVAGAALRAATTQEWQAMSQLQMCVPLGRRGLLEHHLHEFSGAILTQHNHSGGALLVISVPTTRLGPWRERALQLCAGQVEFREAED